MRAAQLAKTMRITPTRAALAAFVSLIFTEASAQSSDDLGAAGTALPDSPEQWVRRALAGIRDDIAGMTAPNLQRLRSQRR